MNYIVIASLPSPKEWKTFFTKEEAIEYAKSLATRYEYVKVFKLGSSIPVFSI